VAVGDNDDVVDDDCGATTAGDDCADDVEEDIVVGFDRFVSDITLLAADISAVSSTRTVQGGDA
jgi:hypothetical protein